MNSRPDVRDSEPPPESASRASLAAVSPGARPWRAARWCFHRGPSTTLRGPRKSPRRFPVVAVGSPPVSPTAPGWSRRGRPLVLRGSRRRKRPGSSSSSAMPRQDRPGARGRSMHVLLAEHRRTVLPSVSDGVFSRLRPSGIRWCGRLRLLLRCSIPKAGSNSLACWRVPSRWTNTPAWWRSARSCARWQAPEQSAPSSRNWTPRLGQRR